MKMHNKCQTKLIQFRFMTNFWYNRINNDEMWVVK